MNLKTERLIQMASLAYAVWAEDDTDGVSTIGDLFIMEQVAKAVVEEHDPDVDASQWNDLITHSRALSKHLRDFEGDLDGELTMRVVEVATALRFGSTGDEVLLS